MGSCLGFCGGRGRRPLPVETPFRLPSPLPSWSLPGAGDGHHGFAKGTIDLGGGLEVCQVSSFTRVWSTREGGPGDQLGATFFRPSPVPRGFCVLGCYAQPNAKPLFGWVLVGRDVGGGARGPGALKRPVGYTLLWSSENYHPTKLAGRKKEYGDGYFWLPLPPQGYRAVGLLVTSSPAEPSPEEIRCVREDLTDACEDDGWVWGDGDGPNGGFNVHHVRPAKRGSGAVGVCVGTCAARGPSKSTTSSAAALLWCLKNNNDKSPAAAMPNRIQIDALMQTYSPWIHFHPEERYLPSSVGWFFDHGALLYHREDPAAPSPVDSEGSNLPRGGSADGAFWLDLPEDGAARDRIKGGNLQLAEAYVHVKPALGGTFTDMAVWLFYPFNGPATVKVGSLNIAFRRMGEHVGDWEHVTLRVSNFTGGLWRVYFAAHGGGAWVDASQVEFKCGNKPVAYSSLRGHAAYAKPGLVLNGDELDLGMIGVRDDTASGGLSMDTGKKYRLVAADHLEEVVAPPWLEYYRGWGPDLSFDIVRELEKVGKLLPPKLREKLEKVVRGLPKQILGEEGPSGPKEKRNWSGDEVN